MNIEQEIDTIKNKIKNIGTGVIYDIKGGMKERRDININSSTDDIKTVLATLIKDLKKQGILK